MNSPQDNTKKGHKKTKQTAEALDNITDTENTPQKILKTISRMHPGIIDKLEKTRTAEYILTAKARTPRQPPGPNSETTATTESIARILTKKPTDLTYKDIETILKTSAGIEEPNDAGIWHTSRRMLGDTLKSPKNPELS